MRKPACPSCGAPYNGRRCRNCNYEHFSEEIAHGNHTHTGEPLVIDAPVRKPVPKKNPFGCDKKTRKKNPLVGFLALLYVISCLMPVLRNWGLKLEATEEWNRTATPEPVVQAADMVIFHQEDDITIFTTPESIANPDAILCTTIRSKLLFKLCVILALDKPLLLHNIMVDCI